MIVPHPAYSDPVMIEQFILTEFMMDKPVLHLSRNAVENLLELHPIFVVKKNKDDNYFCIGGIRSLSIARNCLMPLDVVSVMLLNKIKIEVAGKRCLTDIFVTSCLSLRSSESLYRFIELIPDDQLSELFKKPHGVSLLARMLNVSRETIRKWKKKSTTTKLSN